jgi:hypothetical protein
MIEDMPNWTGRGVAGRESVARASSQSTGDEDSDTVGEAEPMLAEPSRKVTLPAGIPAVEVTLAVSVTAAPAATGLGTAVSTMEVGAGAGALTTSETAVEVLADTPAVPA